MAPGRRWIAIRCIALACSIAAANCASRPDLDARIREMEDRRDPSTARWSMLALDDDPSVRARSARAIGRVRTRALAAVLADAMRDETSVTALQEQLFALGQIGGEDALAAARALLTDSNPSVRARAVEAVGKIGGARQLEEVLRLLTDASAEVRTRALSALSRMCGSDLEVLRGSTETVRRELRLRLASLCQDADADVRLRAMETASLVEIDGALDLYLFGLESQQDWVRWHALQGIARFAASTVPLERLIVACDDPNLQVATAAVNAVASTRRKPALFVLFEILRKRTAPADLHLRATAIRALGDWSIGEDQRTEMVAVFVQALDDSSMRVRAEALRALAPLDPPRAVATYQNWRMDPALTTRTAAAEAAPLLPWEAIGAGLLEWAKSDEAGAHAALQALEFFPDAREQARDAALAVIGCGEIAREACALRLLAKVGKPLDVAYARAAYHQLPGHEAADARLAAVEAALALDTVNRELVREALRDPSPAVRQAAALGLGDAHLADQLRAEEAMLEDPSTPVLQPGIDFDATGANPRVVLITARGDIELELFREQAPRHVRNFLDFATNHRYDGLKFHQVEPGFVVQGLDPRGDGWGSGGVFLRDEINTIEFEPGTVGMPNGGPDTGGCQIFLTLVPAAHLSGRYTAFGRVVRGAEAANAIDLGDRVIGVRIIPR